MFIDVNRYIEENCGIKYLLFASTDRKKEALKNYTKIWKGTKRKLEVINDDEPIEHRKDLMKIRFESDDDLLWVNIQYCWHDHCCCICSWKKMIHIIHKFLTWMHV